MPENIQKKRITSSTLKHNINSLLLKVDEVRHIAKVTKAAIIGITESNLDNTVLDSEISITGFDLVRYDRNRHGGGVACYIKKDVCYNVKKHFSDDIENIFFDILLPKTKPITIGILYRPPKQHNFIEKLSDQFSKLHTEANEIYILGDLNVNLIQNGVYILDKHNNFNW